MKILIVDNNDVGKAPQSERVVTVCLEAMGNPDFGQDPNRPVAAHKMVTVEGIDHASRVCREYIESNLIGAGNWTGGQMYLNGKFIGKISYNGRFWPRGHEYAK